MRLGGGGCSFLVQTDRVLYSRRVAWGDDIFGPLQTAFATPAWLDTLERHRWMDAWRAPVLDAVDELGIETRRYGPVQATVIGALPQAPLLNLVLGAAEPGAISGGHLEEALAWIESRGIQCRVPVGAHGREAGAAEDVLNRCGYRRRESQVRFMRDTAPPEFPVPLGIATEALTECTEGFAEMVAEAFGLDPLAQCFFDCLPERCDWRCYRVSGEDGSVIGGGAMLLHFEIAQLAFAAVKESGQGRGGQMALLHQRILDAAAAGCHTVFADTTEPYDDPDAPSLAARNLVSAGFEQHSVRQVWQSA
jgi:hypothetical protein